MLIYCLKALVIGYGSIGSRHIQNLSLISNMEIVVQTKQKMNTFLKKNNCKLVETINTAIKEQPDFAIISTETNSHLKIATKLAQNNIPFLLEKPLSHTLNGLDKLLKIVKEKKLITLMGCPLRFHPSLKKIKQLLEQKKLGKIYSVYSENGSFLPDWHSKEDYRKSYAARKELGGGVLLTNIHEIDYLYWFFGKIRKVSAMSGKISNLVLNVEDYALIHLDFFNKMVADIYLDFFQISKSRKLKIVGAKGILTCDLTNNKVMLYTTKKPKWIVVSKPIFDLNKMYVDELNHFIQCLQNHETTKNPITTGAEVLKTVFLIKKSVREKRMINYNEL